jgi:hypothetical protein
MEADSGVQVKIQWFTFDGNRTMTSSCTASLASSNLYADVQLHGSGLAFVENSAFIRAPYESLHLGASLEYPVTAYASYVLDSDWGMGLVNSTRNYNLTPQQSANRVTGVWMFDDYTGAYYNHFMHQGTAAINSFSGNYQYIIGNFISRNRYEMVDGVWGGQLYITSAAASIANNVINGDYWHTSLAQQSDPTQPNYTICAPGYNANAGTNVFPHGIEGSGDYNRYYNNEINQNLGYGMLLSGSLKNTIISGYDPFCTSTYRCTTFTPQYVEYNAGCWSFSPQCFPVNNFSALGGITIDGQTYTNHNIVLDHVRSQYNGRAAVAIQNVQTNTSGTGFVDSVGGGNKACIGHETPYSWQDLTTTGTVSSAYTSFTLSCP